MTSARSRCASTSTALGWSTRRTHSSATARGLPKATCRATSRAILTSSSQARCQTWLSWSRTACHGSDGPDEIVVRGILQDEPGDTCIHELADLFVDGQEVHDNEVRIRKHRSNRPGDLQAAGVVESDVEQHHARLELHEPVRMKARRSKNDLHVVEIVEHVSHAFAQQAIVLDNCNSDHAVRQCISRSL